MLEVLKMLEVPGLLLAAIVIYLLFNALSRIEEQRSQQLTRNNEVLLEIARGYERLSSLIDSLIRRDKGGRSDGQK